MWTRALGPLIKVNLYIRIYAEDTMKKLILVTLTALAVASMSLRAQGGAIDELFTNSAPRVAAPAVSGPAIVAQPVGQAPVQREWLVLVFINGVNDLGLLGFADKSINDMEKVGSNDKMAVVVEYGILGIADPATRTLKIPKGTKTIYIKQDADAGKITSQIISTSTASDMGSVNSMVRFAKRAIRRYPANKLALVIWNHGAGRLGISYDDMTKNHMEVDQLGQGLAQIKSELGHNINVFATDACLMQMAAVAYELRNSADVIVGSEEVIPGNSYPYDTILGQLGVNTGMNAEQLGVVMVDAYKASYPAYAAASGNAGSGEVVTLSALRTSALPGFVGKLNNWVDAVMNDPQALKIATSKAAVDGAYYFYMEDSKDLYTYISSVNSKLGIKGPGAKNAGTALQNYIKNSLIIRNGVLPVSVKAQGMAIYIPELTYNSSNYEKLAFAADSYWDDYLRTMMEERLK